MKNKHLLIMVFAIFLCFSYQPVYAQIIADHNAVREFDLYKNTTEFQNAIQRAKSMFHIGYGHTSHGSQITSGLTGFNTFMNNLGYPQNLFSWNNGGTNGALDLEEGAGYGNGWLDHDCGYSGWDTETRDYLNGHDTDSGLTADHSDVNVIMWSWCGQVNDVDIQSHYLDRMASLENDYPDVTFIYMTGHLEGYKTGDSWFNNNNAIRQWVNSSPDRVLFDFADIEKYDPDQQVNYADYFANDHCDYDPDGQTPIDRSQNWALNWQNSHTENIDWYSVSCAHSVALNCNQKAKAFWWMMARLAGWSPEKQKPEITSAPEELVDGENVTIYGRGFKDHPDFSPFVSDILNTGWHDFENGNFTGKGIDLYPWYRENFNLIHGDSNRRNSNSFLRKQYVISEGGAYGLYQHGNHTKWYWTFWFMMPVNCQSGKFTRLWGGESPGSLPSVYLSSGGLNYNIRGDMEGYPDQWTSPDSFKPNHWHRVDVFMNKITHNFSVYMDGKFQWARDWVPDNFGGDGRMWEVGGMIDGPGRNYWNPNGSYNFDDVYFDYTPARIELCNESAWNESKMRHCEIQIPVSWSDNSITFTANQGSFQPGEQAYLFVIDENGTASEGYPITIGSANAHVCESPDKSHCYYVDNETTSTDWLSCNNISTPCTPETAMQNAQAGDIVYFRGGIYQIEQTLQALHSGNPGNPITFKAYPGEIPLLNGRVQVKVTGTADEGSDNYTLVDNDVDFIQAGVSSWDIVRTAYKEGGAPVSSVQDAHTVILSEEGVHNSIDLKPGDAYTIGKDSVTLLSNNYQDYIVFDGFVVQADNGEENARILIRGPETYDRAVGNVVRNCIIIGGTRKIVHGDNREGLRIEDTNNTLVQNCLIYGQKSIKGWHNTGAIKMYHNFNTTIENCEFTSTTLAIFDKSDSENSTYRYNYIHDCDRGILFTGYAWTGFVSNHRNIKVHDNLIVRCGGIGDTEQEWADSDNMEVHDNTIYGDSNHPVGISLGPGRKKVYNNIIYGRPRDYDLGILRFLSGEYEDGTRRNISILASDHNFFGDIEGSFCVRTIKPDSNGELVYTTYWTLSDWQSSHELDSPVDVGCGFSDNPGCGSIVGNPKFLNSSGTMSEIEDFKLASDSPCRGAGRNGNDMGADINLVGYNGSGWVPSRYCGDNYCDSGESCPSCPECCHRADLNKNGRIETHELLNFINQWKHDNASIMEIMDVLRLWKNV